MPLGNITNHEKSYTAFTMQASEKNHRRKKLPSNSIWLYVILLHQGLDNSEAHAHYVFLVLSKSHGILHSMKGTEGVEDKIYCSNLEIVKVSTA